MGTKPRLETYILAHTEISPTGCAPTPKKHRPRRCSKNPLTTAPRHFLLGASGSLLPTFSGKSGGMPNVTEKCSEYETSFGASLLKVLGEIEVDKPWAAVVLAYHHGQSFVPAIGVMTAAEYAEAKDSFDSPEEVFNPAEWENYDDWSVDEDVEALGIELEELLSEDEAEQSPLGRDTLVRVCQGLRPELVKGGLLAADGLCYCCEYTMGDLEGNVRAINPADALAARGW